MEDMMEKDKSMMKEGRMADEKNGIDKGSEMAMGGMTGMMKMCAEAKMEDLMKKGHSKSEAKTMGAEMAKSGKHAA